MRQVNITIFSGGSGNKEFIEHLNNIKSFKINIITNCYDDGKSTGLLRNLIPNMLGPSDIRKNISNLLNSSNYEENNLKEILEFRLKKIRLSNFLKNKQIKKILKKISHQKYKEIEHYLLYLQKYFSKLDSNYNDMSLGNLIFAGIFLKYKKFNTAVKIMNLLFLNEMKVHNVTNGRNAYLYGIREDGKILDEGQMVENEEKKIEDIFLFKNKINFNVFNNQKINKNKFIPSLNPSIQKLIKNSDLIIYGPGTQYSSLFPSYITKNLNELILKSKAKKIFISNIFFDNDIHNESVEGLIDKFYYFFNKKKKNKRLIDYYFINRFDEDDLNNVNKKKYLQLTGSLKKKKIIHIDWEKSNGKHYPGILIKEILKILKIKSIDKQYKTVRTISIIIPCYNEERRVGLVLSKLKKLNFKEQNLQTEIIVIDGNSTDKSLEIIKKFKFCKIYSMKKSGKGFALNFGVKKAKGDVICFFPADNEYSIDDIKNVIEPIISNNSNSVLGSRLIKCVNLSDQIKKIYNKNFILYFLSKYGGMIMSIGFLLFYNRYITDPLSSLKAFRSELINKLKIYSTSFDYDIELIAKVLRTKNYILEVPVKYKPRSKSQGKKITIKDGLRCLYKIFKFSF